MHAEGMIHGDLKGVGLPILASLCPLICHPSKANILVDQHRHARLADFGLITFVSDPENSITPNSHPNAGTVRWMSPELFGLEGFGLNDSRRTKYSDCYALGMVIFEVLSGQVPFPRDDNIYTVVAKVARGERPKRPEGKWFTNELWKTLEQCWSPKPEDRPAVDAVLDCLGRVSASQPLPSANEIVQVGIGNKLHSATGYRPCTFLHLIWDLTLKPPAVKGIISNLPQIIAPRSDNLIDYTSDSDVGEVDWKSFKTSSDQVSYIR
jgi:serine/threonine protein kinase